MPPPSSSHLTGIKEAVSALPALAMIAPHCPVDAYAQLHTSTFAHNLARRERLYASLRGGLESLRRLNAIENITPPDDSAIAAQRVIGQASQTALAERFNMPPSVVRGRISRGLQQVAREQQVPPDRIKEFVRQIKSHDFFLALHPWRAWVEEWLRFPLRTALPPVLYAVPVSCLPMLPGFESRIARMILWRMLHRVGGECECALKPFINKGIVGIEVAAEFILGPEGVHAIPLGRFALALYDEGRKSRRSLLLYQRRKRPEPRIGSTSGAVGELTRLVYAAGPVDIELALGPRPIVTNGNGFSFVSLFSTSFPERPAHVVVPAKVVKWGCRFLSLALPRAAIAHCLTHGSFSGARIQVLAHQQIDGEVDASKDQTTTPDAPVPTFIGHLMLHELSTERVRHELQLSGAVSRTSYHGVRVVLGNALRAYLDRRESGKPHYTPIRVCRPARDPWSRAGRVCFCDFEFVLPRNYTGRTVVPVAIDLKGNRAVLAFFSPEANPLRDEPLVVYSYSEKLRYASDSGWSKLRWCDIVGEREHVTA